MRVEASAGRKGNLAFGATRLVFRAESLQDQALLKLLLDSWTEGKWTNMDRRFQKTLRELFEHEFPEEAKERRRSARRKTPRKKRGSRGEREAA